MAVVNRAMLWFTVAVDMYTHLTPVCNPKGQQSGLEGYILSNSVAKLSYVGILRIFIKK